MRKLASGRWQAMYLDPVTRRRVTGPSTFATKADASRWLSGVEAEMVRGVHVDPRAGEVPFGTFAQEWLAGKATLRPSTQELYEYLLRVHILPAFGSIELSAITPAMVRTWFGRLGSASGLSQTSAAKAYRLLRQILASAVDDSLIVANPCRIKGAAAERSAERTIPTLAEVGALADAVPPRYRAMVLLAGFAGLRLGECLGLTRANVNLANIPPTVRVEQAIVELQNGKKLRQDPKTEAGRRTLALPAVLAAELQWHLDTYVAPEPDALLFTGSRGGGTPQRTTWRRIWLEACVTTGVECTFHDLRHVAGTLNATAGATLKEAMARLGHASPVAALRYQHAVQSRDAEIASAIDRLLQPNRSRDPTAG